MVTSTVGLNKSSKLLIAAILMLLMLSAVVLSPASVKACTQRAVYTDYYNGKPSVMIYTGSNVPPNQNNTVIMFNVAGSGWKVVPTPSDNGVRTDAPQNNSGGWHTYFIATRWYTQPQHWQWNTDGLWRVYEC